MGELIRLDTHRPAVEPLWREVVGKRLRERRQHRGSTLTETAARAGISPQYLSELERGRKDPSSEILAAVVGALGTSMAEISGQAYHDLSGSNATLLAA
jgi:transcriptional regulator with XRE-family HTH domain